MFGRTKQQLAALRQEHAALIADNVEKDEKIARLDAEAQRLAERVRDLRAAEAKHMKAMAQQVRATEEAERSLRTTATMLNDTRTERNAGHEALAALRCVSPQFLAVLDQMDSEVGWTAVKLAEDATAEMNQGGIAGQITPAFANAVQRALHALGWAEFGTLYSHEDDRVRGRGYWLSPRGEQARKALRIAADHLTAAAEAKAIAA